MAALLNIKRCNTLNPMTDFYKQLSSKTGQEREEQKKMEEDTFYPELEVGSSTRTVPNINRRNFLTSETSYPRI